MKIVISGTVGVGKSSVSKLLYKKISKKNNDVKLYAELKEENPYLSFYYTNRPSWSFLTQIDFLLSRYKTLMYEEIEQKKNPNRISIFDRHFLDDYVFANLYSIKEDMGHISFNKYKIINNALSERISLEQQPDLFILLQTDLDSILKRIKNRAIKEEQNVDYAYWEDLYNQYYLNPKITSYLQKNCKKIIKISASNSVENIVDEILTQINL